MAIYNYNSSWKCQWMICWWEIKLETRSYFKGVRISCMRQFSSDCHECATPWQMLTSFRDVWKGILYFQLVKELNNHDLAGECIKCFVGNVTEAKPENLVDCDNLGIQREELYCRNITIYQNGGENSPIESVQRSCVAMSWYWMSSPNHYWTSHSITFNYYRFDNSWESIGCHESINGKEKIMRCTCESDYCNAPPADWMVVASTGGGSFPLTPHCIFAVLTTLILVVAQ